MRDATRCEVVGVPLKRHCTLSIFARLDEQLSCGLSPTLAKHFAYILKIGVASVFGRPRFSFCRGTMVLLWHPCKFCMYKQRHAKVTVVLGPKALLASQPPRHSFGLRAKLRLSTLYFSVRGGGSYRRAHTENQRIINCI